MICSALIHPAAAEAQARLRKPEQAGESARQSVWRLGIRPRLSACRCCITRSGGSRIARKLPRPAESWSFVRRKSKLWTNWCRRRRMIVKILKGRKTGTPKEAYSYIASMPAEMMAFIETEMPNPPVLVEVPQLRSEMAAAATWPCRPRELDALGVPRGPKFDKIIEQFFEMQLRGQGKTPEDRTKAAEAISRVSRTSRRKAGKRKEEKAAARRKTRPRPQRQPERAREQRRNQRLAQPRKAERHRQLPRNLRRLQRRRLARSAQAKHEEAADEASKKKKPAESQERQQRNNSLRPREFSDRITLFRG